MQRSLVVPAIAWLAAVIAAPAPAQPSASLVAGARVRVSAPRHRASGLTGSLLRVDSDSIWIRTVRRDSTWRLNERNIWVLTDVGPPRDTTWAAPVDALTRVEVSTGRRTHGAGMVRGAVRGFLYTGAVGALLGLFIRDPGDGFFYEDPGGGALFWGIFLGTLGGTVGGLYGLAAPGERWQRLPLPLRHP
jgi:hypothetical protein